MTKFKKILLTVWELPQNIVGYLVLKISAAKYIGGYLRGGIYANVYHWKHGSGLSLGRYIFVPFDSLTVNDLNNSENEYKKNYIHHEHGHSIQSKKLGWLYLIVIGLPSLIWAGCFKQYRKKYNKSYYWFYTERWADKLGGVVR